MRRRAILVSRGWKICGHTVNEYQPNRNSAVAPTHRSKPPKSVKIRGATCPDCGKRCKNENGLKDHFAAKHQTDQPETAAMVTDAIMRQTGPFSVSDLQRACPGVSVDMIRTVLKRLKEREVECLGRGQSAKWQRKATAK